MEEEYRPTNEPTSQRTDGRRMRTYKTYGKAGERASRQGDKQSSPRERERDIEKQFLRRQSIRHDGENTIEEGRVSHIRTDAEGRSGVKTGSPRHMSPAGRQDDTLHSTSESSETLTRDFEPRSDGRLSLPGSQRRSAALHTGRAT